VSTVVGGESGGEIYCLQECFDFGIFGMEVFESKAKVSTKSLRKHIGLAPQETI
jgi:hypothetical protein